MIFGFKLVKITTIIVAKAAYVLMYIQGCKWLPKTGGGGGSSNSSSNAISNAAPSILPKSGGRGRQIEVRRCLINKYFSVFIWFTP